MKFPDYYPIIASAASKNPHQDQDLVMQPISTIRTGIISSVNPAHFTENTFAESFCCRIEFVNNYDIFSNAFNAQFFYIKIVSRRRKLSPEISA